MVKRKSDDKVAVVLTPGTQQLANPLLGVMGVYQDIEEAKEIVKEIKGQLILTTYYKEDDHGKSNDN